MQEKLFNIPLSEIALSDTNIHISASNYREENDEAPAAGESGEDTEKRSRQQFMAEKREPWRKGRRF